MSRRSLVLSPLIAMLVGAAPALADQPKSVTATGTGQTLVVPKDRKSNASITAAVEAAKKGSVRVRSPRRTSMRASTRSRPD